MWNFLFISLKSLKPFFFQMRLTKIDHCQCKYSMAQIRSISHAFFFKAGCKQGRQNWRTWIGTKGCHLCVEIRSVLAPILFRVLIFTSPEKGKKWENHETCFVLTYQSNNQNFLYYVSTYFIEKLSQAKASKTSLSSALTVITLAIIVLGPEYDFCMPDNRLK